MLGDSLRRRYGAENRPPRDPETRPSRPKRSGRGGGPFGFPWWQWLLAALVVLAGSFGVGYLLSTQMLFPRPETAGTGIPVPSLHGDMQEEAEARIREAGLLPGEVTAMASMDAERGRVLAQDPLPGQQLRAGAAVSFAVSSGPPELRVPPLAGMDQESARRLLESVGFDVDIRQVRTGGVSVGVVTRSDPPAGAARTLPTVVTILINSGAPVDSVEADSPLPGPPPGGAAPADSPAAGRGAAAGGRP